MGLLVAFDPEEFVPYALGESGVGFAIGCSISWFLDCTISLKKKAIREYTRRNSKMSSSDPIRYMPTPTFVSDRAKVESGESTPPRPSVVAAHIRHLRTGYPNPRHLAEAPTRLRKRMKSHDTWVRRHNGGGGSSSFKIKKRLGKHSALADSLGLLDQQQKRAK